jgi:hypothetical protein
MRNAAVDRLIGAERIGEISDGRCRHDTEKQDVDARARETGNDRRFEEFPARTAITGNVGGRPVAGERPHISEDVRCGDREVKC